MLFFARFELIRVVQWNIFLRLFHIILRQEMNVGLSEPFVKIEEFRRISTSHRFFGPSTGKRELIEDGLVSTEEGVREEFMFAVWIVHRMTDVEDLTLIVHIGKVTILLGTFEGCSDISHN